MNITVKLYSSRSAKRIVSAESLTRRLSWLMTCFVSCIIHTLWESWSFTEWEKGIEGLHRRLHSDYIVRRESPFGHLWSRVHSTKFIKLYGNLKIQQNSLVSLRTIQVSGKRKTSFSVNYTGWNITTAT